MRRRKLLMPCADLGERLCTQFSEIASPLSLQCRILAFVPKLSKRRFDALAGYTRLPSVVLIAEELEWFSEADDRILGVLIRDRIDQDFSWVVLGRDRRHRFRAVDLKVSISSKDVARQELLDRMHVLRCASEEQFYQGDEVGGPVDFFTPVVPHEQLHPFFALLISDERYSPARGLIAAMMRYHDDVDGNFVQQFQTTGFDSRLWELYLFAVLVEQGYARDSTLHVPDFVAGCLKGEIGIEAVTANPPQGRTVEPPRTPEEITDFLQNQIPFKLAKGLTRKLRRDPPYWSERGMAGIPFVIAVQDFHAPGTMRMIVPAATEYVFGFRHSRKDGVLQIERITEHRVGSSSEKSGFFSSPGAENVSAVIVNPQGTLMKFNRMGLLAGFGSPRVRMTRSGVLRREGRPDGPEPRKFSQEVTSGSTETWIEGMVVFHNPNALVPLDPDLLDGANHEFVEPDGRILSLVPEFHPYFSQTQIFLNGEGPRQEEG